MKKILITIIMMIGLIMAKNDLNIGDKAPNFTLQWIKIQLNILYQTILGKR